MPTTIEFADLKLPEYVKGIKQDTLQGTSLLYSVTDAKSPSRHTDQYYYIFGSRAIYKDGWKAETAHHPDYIDINDSSAGKGPIVRNFDNDVWELYNLDNDFNERIDLAKKNPEKLKELQALFDLQAKKFNIYPFIDWDDVFKLRIHNNKNNNTASK